MAASLTRPDPSSPASVADAGFSTARRGYQPDEVRAFLTSVAAEMTRLQERERRLEAELLDARAQGMPAELDEDTVAALLGEETVRVLQTARESASEIKARAEENAARILREASEESKRLRHEAEVESARRRQDASSNAEAEIALAKQQGREMVNEARAYRERVLADLERRTTLARNQIEELLHGRDRLLQVFERARLVAVDVTSELQAVDSPDELVNLAPTTGPVPVMVPNARRADAADRTEPVDRAESTATEIASTIAEITTVDDADESPDETDAAAIELDAVESVVDAGIEVVDGVSGDELDVDEIEIAGEAVDETDEPDASDSCTSIVDDEPVDVHDAADDETADDSTNVVSLFPERIEADEHDAVGRPDVGGIFARLRDEVDDDDTDTDATPDDVAADDDALAPSSAFERRDEALVPLIVGSARTLKRILADEQNGVLDTLRGKDVVADLDDLLPDADEHTGVYLAALSDDLRQAARAGAEELGGTVGLDAADLEAAVHPANELVRTDLIGPLRERLSRAIGDGGGDNESVARIVRAVYREWKTKHIDGQLDDVFRFAHGAGVVAGAGDVELVWSLDPAVTASPDCEDNSLAGPVRAGEAYPTGHTAAPAHPGCRCLTLPTAR